MKTKSFLTLALTITFGTSAFSAPGDIKIQQMNSGGTAYSDRIIPASGATQITNLASFRTALGMTQADVAGLTIASTPTFAGLTLGSTATITGAGSQTVVLASDGSIAMNAAGSNQSVTVSPSGSGSVRIGGSGLRGTNTTWSLADSSGFGRFTIASTSTIINGPSGSDGISIATTGAVTFGSSITTAAPTAGSAAATKFGGLVTGVALVVSTTQGIRINSGGTDYTVALLTTNP